MIHGKIPQLGVTVIPSIQIIRAKVDLALSLSVGGITHPTTGHVFDLGRRAEADDHLTIANGRIPVCLK